MTKIKYAQVHALKVPVRIGLSYGEVKETNHIVVSIRTDSQVEGVGEGTPYLTDLYKNYALCKRLVGVIEGMDLSEAKDSLPQIQLKLMEKPFFDYGPFLALQTAVIDAECKANSVGFAQMLGGEYRRRIPVCGIVFLQSLPNMVEVAQKWISMGITHLKIKVTGRNEEDLRIIRSIREAVGSDVVIRIDANQAYEVMDTAARRIKRLERYEVAIVEQPIKWNDLDGLRRLRKLVEPKIMVDESLRKPSDVGRIAAKEAADIINFHPSKLGCLSITREAIQKTADLGLDYLVGSAVMTGVGMVAHLHLTASMEKLHYPNEEIGLYNMFGRDVVKCNTSRIVGGCIEIPRDYGVGVRIDDDKLKEYSVNMSTLRGFLALAVHQAYLRSKWPGPRPVHAWPESSS